MAKLSKAQAKLHAQACELLKKDVLTEDDKWFVLEHWQESANHVNTTAGAFFTPPGLANDFSVEIGGSACRRIIDLCAGIGGLSFRCHQRGRWNGEPPEIVCVELNPDYIAVGKKILPEATWICASVFDLPDLGRFDFAISNPPFGATPRNGGKGPTYTGDKFEYHVIDVASKLALFGVFIIPQMSAGFTYSGRPYFERNESDAYKKFKQQTGISLEPGCGIDCDYYKNDWHGVSVTVEVVTSEFHEPESQTCMASATTTSSESQLDLFAELAGAAS
ncbi:hypothetical protein [Stenotrophomonas sp.]|uniref:hypothetical protein n=1 Tax=Stenotrophomonas sp. TaxID=69392 RepID=UPI00289C404E|nr:hypothetical protein [Stenotrophomonas sp.]